MGSPDTPADAPAGRLPGWLSGVSLVLITWAVYHGSLANGFVQWDDPVHLIENERLRPPSASSVARFWTEPFAGLYVPVAYTYWSVLTWFAAGGREGIAGDALAPFVFHLGQLGLHLACVLLVFRLLRKLVDQPFAAWAGALVFAVHPLQVESVAWVSEARGLLATLFALAALLLHASPEADGKPSRGRALVALACAVLACLSKPSAVVLPALALLLDVGALGLTLRRSLGRLWPWFLVSLLAIGYAKALQPDEAMVAVAAPTVRPWIAADALGFYVTKLLWPARLCVDYGRTPDVVVARGLAHLTWLLAILATVLAAALPCRRRALTVWALFVAALAPVLGLIPFAHQVYSTVTDRYTYLAMTAAALASAWVLARFPGRLSATIALTTIAALGVASVSQTQHWRDSRVLFGHALEVNPESWVAHNNLGYVHDQRYEFEWAREAYERSLAIAPENHMTFNGLGNLAVRQGDVQGALASYRRVLELRPGHSKTMSNLQQLTARIETWNASAAQLRAGIEENPGEAFLHAGLGRVTQDLGRRREAAELYRKGVALAGRPGAAALDLAWLLSTAPEADVRSGDEALVLVESLRGTKHATTARFRFVRAAALAEAERTTEAIASAERALEDAHAEGRERFARRIAGWLALMRGGVVPRGRQRLTSAGS